MMMDEEISVIDGDEGKLLGQLVQFCVGWWDWELVD